MQKGKWIAAGVAVAIAAVAYAVDVKISELPAVSSLTGTEQVPVNQAGTTRRTTTQAIANLFSGVPTSRTITAGTGLTGGGDLSANRTISIADGGVNTTQLTDDGVTFAKLQNITTDRLLGRDTAGSGNTEEISVGGGLEFTGSTSIQRSALTGDVTASAGSNSTTIANDAVTFGKFQDIATDRILGRDTALSGNVEELTVSGGLEFTGTGIQRSALTGDVTASAGSGSTTIANNAVTYAKMQDVSATSRFLGRITSGAGDTEELTGTQATTLLNNFTDALKGLAPASGGGTTNFLRADGNWVAPPGTTAGANPSASIGLTATNGVAATFMRSDAAPALSQAIAPTWTNTHTFANASLGIWVNSDTPMISIWDSGESANQRNFTLGSESGVLELASNSDAFGSPLAILQANRGTTIVLGNASSNPDFTWAGSGDWNIGGGVGTSGQVLTSNGSGAAPTWQNAGGGSGANPTASVGLSAVNGVATTFMRSDGAPALSQAIAPTWSAQHIFSNVSDATASSAALTSNRPALELRELDAAADNERWQWLVSGESFVGLALSDSGAADALFLQVDRTGTTIDTINLTATNVQINGTNITAGSTSGTTGSVTGCTTTPTTTYRYERSGNLVVGRIAGITCTSNTTAFTIASAIPASWRPAANTTVAAICTNNGTTDACGMVLQTGGTVSFNLVPNNAFTNSGTKGLSFDTSFSYLLN